MEESRMIILYINEVTYDGLTDECPHINMDDRILTEHIIADEVMSILTGTDSNTVQLQGWEFDFIRDLHESLEDGLFSHYYPESVEFHAERNNLIVSLIPSPYSIED